jgi:tRNA(Ile2) C34 agmatinyltransferase TiaS
MKCPNCNSTRITRSKIGLRCKKCNYFNLLDYRKGEQIENDIKRDRKI